MRTFQRSRVPFSPRSPLLHSRTRTVPFLALCQFHSPASKNVNALNTAAPRSLVLDHTYFAGKLLCTKVHSDSQCTQNQHTIVA